MRWYRCKLSDLGAMAGALPSGSERDTKQKKKNVLGSNGCCVAGLRLSFWSRFHRPSVESSNPCVRSQQRRKANTWRLRLNQPPG